VTFVLVLAAGFLVGFFVPTRIMVMCLVPVAVIAVNVVYAMLLHESLGVISILTDMVVAYPTALSINRFMHD
jgi:uncharacterized membrane protein (Fun14 family)